MITLKKKDSDEDPKDITDLDSQVRRIYSDLIRLEPLRRAMGKKSLDIMFIMDCTGSMSPWIEACKREIKSVIDCIRNQYFNIQIRVSIVAYRDYSVSNPEKNMYDLYPFSTNIEECLVFLKNLRAIGNRDLCEDVAGGLNHALQMEW